jgi:hypothetical protein
MKLLAPLRLSGLLVLLALLCAAPLRSQSSPEEIREELRQVLRSAGYASLLASLLASFVQLGVREDLGSASSLRIDDEFSTKYELFRLGGGFDPTRFDNGDRLILEGDIGHITSSFATSDLFQGSAPGIATGIDQKLTSFSARVGLGYRHELGAGFYVRPMVDLFGGVLENEARYSGPGAATVGPLFDGLFFNWDSKFVGANGSLGLGFERSWDERYPFFRPQHPRPHLAADLRRHRQRAGVRSHGQEPDHERRTARPHRPAPPRPGAGMVRLRPQCLVPGFDRRRSRLLLVQRIRRCPGARHRGLGSADR